jgi:transposase-like protein
VIYIDGLIFGDYTMIGAVGVDSACNKHVLGIRKGATENSTVVSEPLEDIVARGVDPKHKMLVIDGSKALRAAINQCKDDAHSSCVTCSTIFPKNSGTKPRACCGRPGN